MAKSFTNNNSHPVADILVVDDQPEITDLVAEVLSDEGYFVRVAHDGLAALNAIICSPPRLLILDVAMPLMRGDQLVHKLRSSGNTELPIILMTADRSPECYTSLGIDELLRKPFDIGSLLQAVADHVGRIASKSFAPQQPGLALERKLGA